MVSFDATVLITAFFGISVLSILYKDNPFYRFTEHTYVGLATAHYLVLSINLLQKSAIKKISGGDYIWILPVILAIMINTRLFPKYRYLSRWPMAVMIGVGIGVSARAIIASQVTAQIIATIQLASIVDPTPINIARNVALLLSTPAAAPPTFS